MKEESSGGSLICHPVPFGLVILDQDLVVQPIHLRLHRGHILREMKEARGYLGSQKLQVWEILVRLSVRLFGADHESPFTEGRHVNVVGSRPETYTLQGLTTHQNERRAKRGEVAWTAANPRSERQRYSWR